MSRREATEPAFEDGTPEPLTDVLAGASDRLNGQLPDISEMLIPITDRFEREIERAGVEIVAGVTADASQIHHAQEPNNYRFTGHTDGSHAAIVMQTTILESEIDNINEEIRMTTDEAAYLVRIIEANRDDKLARLTSKRDNALKSAEALEAMKRVLGRVQ